MVLWPAVGVALLHLREISVSSHTVTICPHSPQPQSTLLFCKPPMMRCATWGWPKERASSMWWLSHNNVLKSCSGAFWGFSWTEKKIHPSSQNSLTGNSLRSKEVTPSSAPTWWGVGLMGQRLPYSLRGSSDQGQEASLRSAVDKHKAALSNITVFNKWTICLEWILLSLKLFKQTKCQTEKLKKRFSWMKIGIRVAQLFLLIPRCRDWIKTCSLNTHWEPGVCTILLEVPWNMHKEVKTQFLCLVLLRKQDTWVSRIIYNSYAKFRT